MSERAHNLAPCSARDALRWARDRLATTDEPALSARLLLAHVLDCPLTELFLRPERLLSAAEAHAYQSLIDRRASHEPVAYLLGYRAFMAIDLLVDRRVLIPRPETEKLVERAIEIVRRWPRPRVVDVGTGSGAIAIGLAIRLPKAKITAIDASPGALTLAQENARRSGVADHITFLHGDLLSPLSEPAEIIVANLPYVSESEYEALPPHIRLHEPRQALVAGPEGLDAIRALLSTAASHLAEGGSVLLEIGATQGQAVAALASVAFPGAQIHILQDLAHHDRIVHVEPSHERSLPRAQ